MPGSRALPALGRTHDRGEIDLDRIPSAVLATPFDLIRHDPLLDFRPLPQTRIRAIVDDLFMPLAALYSGKPADIG